MLDSRTQNSVHGIASDAGMYRSLSYVFRFGLCRSGP